jgi:hypothetical protein
MTGEQFDAILKTAHAKADKDGWQALPDGGTMSLYVAFNGASITVARVEAVKVEGGLLYARTPKRELYAVAKEDVFAVAIDGAAASGQPARRAGFG